MDRPVLYKPLCVLFGEDYLVIPPFDIAYVESNGHFCRIYRISTKTFLMVPVAINELSRVLADPLFCQIHRRYIIFLPQVVGINRRGTRVRTKSGDWLPVGRSFLEPFWKKFHLLR